MKKEIENIVRSAKMNEVIIDGCNVAECKYFNKVVNEEPYCNIDEEHLYTCSSDDNCYFKQLQRAKAENEILHITIEKLKGDLCIAEDSLRDYQEHYNKLEAENEKLKLMLSEKYGVFK